MFFFNLLSNNFIFTIIASLISVIIEIVLIVNIHGKYDVSKTKDFKDQLMIPEDLQELK